MRALIDEFAQREMRADDIAKVLRLTPSGARKYIRDLLGANVIELDRCIENAPGYVGKAVYRLSGDPECVRAYFASMVQPRAGAGGRNKNKDDLGKAGLTMKGIERRVHILTDDVYHVIRVHRSPAQRDPLVAALFGPAKSPNG